MAQGVAGALLAKPAQANSSTTLWPAPTGIDRAPNSAFNPSGFRLAVDGSQSTLSSASNRVGFVTLSLRIPPLWSTF